MAESESDAAPAAEEGREAEAPRGGRAAAAVLAWLIPGAGHMYLGRWGRGILFFVLVLASLGVGLALHGKLWRVTPGQPLTLLGTLACVGLGVPYFVLRFLMDYQGDLVAQGYEYGAAFILTGGLMNVMLILDAWDIARGVKE